MTDDEPVQTRVLRPLQGCWSDPSPLMQESSLKFRETETGKLTKSGG